MKRRYWIRPGAERDLAEAHAWYEEQKLGLGREFIQDFERLSRRILRHPEAYSRETEIVRRALMKRFPYGVFYAVEEERIVVLAVLHLARDPKVIRSRVRMG